ncbi:MAG: MFS transporter, partial [Planctomycetia bacterium]|nr:MFS transporter [Planctomycetia bacterium]
MEHPVPATRTRFVVLAFLGTLVFVLYLDRVCISRAALDIQEEFQLSDTEIGLVFGAFTIAYGLFEVPTGRWGDRFGSRGVLTRIVLWWSAFTALTGCVPAFRYGSGFQISLGGWSAAIPPLVSSFGLLMLIRFLFGAGEAGALPNTARVVARWIPSHERGWAQGAVLTCMQIGGLTAPVVATYLIKSLGWRWSFAVFGSTGVVWGALFYWWYRDDPEQHPSVNSAERELIASGCAHGPAGHDHPPIPWKMVLSSRNVWLLGLIMTASASASYMYMSWFPSYLVKARAVSSDYSGWLTSFVLGGGAIGSFCGGPLGSLVVHWTGEGRWSRRLLGATLLAGAGLLLGSSISCDTPEVACACAAAAAFCGHAQISNWWAATMSISGNHLGAMFGLLNSMGVPGAFGSQVFLGMYVDSRKAAGFLGRDQWDPAFFFYAGVLLFGAACWLLVDPTKSAVEESPPAS